MNMQVSTASVAQAAVKLPIAKPAVPLIPTIPPDPNPPKDLLQSVCYRIAQHKRATREAAGKADGSPEKAIVAEALACVGDAVPKCSRDAALQLSYVWKECGGDIDAVARILDLEQFVEDLMEVTQLPPPRKPMPKQSKRGRLTNAGVLYRYHSYLAMELNLVGHELYGCAKHARVFIPMEGAVQRVIHKENSTAELRAALPRRARKAMRALGINVIRASR